MHRIQIFLFVEYYFIPILTKTRKKKLAIWKNGGKKRRRALCNAWYVAPHVVFVCIYECSRYFLFKKTIAVLRGHSFLGQMSLLFFLYERTGEKKTMPYKALEPYAKNVNTNTKTKNDLVSFCCCCVCVCQKKKKKRHLAGMTYQCPTAI